MSAVVWSIGRAKRAIQEFENNPRSLPVDDPQLRQLVRRNGPALLSYASSSGAHQALPLLLELGAAVRPASLGARLLVEALSWGNVDVFKKLLAADIEPDQSVLDQAVFRYKRPVVRMLLERGLRGDKPGGDKWHRDRSPIHTAASQTWREGLRLFVDAGVAVDLRTGKTRETPFLLVCGEFTSATASACVRYLVGAGADPNARDSKGLSGAERVRVGMANASQSRRPYSRQVQPLGEAMLRVLRRLGAADA